MYDDVQYVCNRLIHDDSSQHEHEHVYLTSTTVIVSKTRQEHHRIIRCDHEVDGMVWYGMYGMVWYTVPYNKYSTSFQRKTASLLGRGKGSWWFVWYGMVHCTIPYHTINIILRPFSAKPPAYWDGEKDRTATFHIMLHRKTRRRSIRCVVCASPRFEMILPSVRHTRMISLTLVALCFFVGTLYYHTQRCGNSNTPSTS